MRPARTATNHPPIISAQRRDLSLFHSADRQELLNNVCVLAKGAKIFGVNFGQYESI
jgi:hypothetical protein